MAHTTPRFTSHRILRLTVLGMTVLIAAMFLRRYLQRPSTLVASPTFVRAQAEPLIKELQSLKVEAIRCPKDVQARWNLVRFYKQHSLIPQAMIQLNTILNLEPNNEKANLELADLLLVSGQQHTAEQAYQDITRRFPRSAEAWLGLSTVEFQQKKFADAMRAAQQASQLDALNPGIKLALAVADLNYALQFTETDSYAAQYDQARTLLTELTHIWPDNGEVYFLLGRTLRVMRRYPEAVISLRRAQQLLPQNPQVITELARAYSFSGDRAAARKLTEDAINKQVANADVYGLFAQLIQQSGGPNSEARSVSAYEQAVHLAPRDASYRERLGSAYLRVNRVEDARRIFEKLVIDDPNQPFPFQQLAAIYARLGLRERSATAATMATRMAVNENQLQQIQLLSGLHPKNAMLHLALADRYAYLRKRGPARDEYNRALNIDPHSARARKGLAALNASEQTLLRNAGPSK